MLKESIAIIKKITENETLAMNVEKTRVKSGLSKKRLDMIRDLNSSDSFPTLLKSRTCC